MRIIIENIIIPIKLFFIKRANESKIKKIKIKIFESLCFVLIKSFKPKIVAPKKNEKGCLAYTKA